MQCIKCQSTNVQKVSVIYESGTEYTHTTGETYHSGTTTGYSSAGNFVYGTYSGTSTSHNTSKKQTILASKFEPPETKSYKTTILLGIVSALVLYFIVYKDSFHWSIVHYFYRAIWTMILGMALAFLFYTGIRYRFYKPPSDQQKLYTNPRILIGTGIVFCLYSLIIGYGDSVFFDDFFALFIVIILCSFGYFLKEWLLRSYDIPFLKKRKKKQGLNIYWDFFDFFSVVTIVYLISFSIASAPYGFSYDFQWNMFVVLLLFLCINRATSRYKQAHDYNKKIYPFAYSEWLNTWHCNSCSCVFRKKRNDDSPLSNTF